MGVLECVSILPGNILKIWYLLAKWLQSIWEGTRLVCDTSVLRETHVIVPPTPPPYTQSAKIPQIQKIIITSVFYYINGPHKQYILLDIIFNFNFHFGLPGTYLYNCSEIMRTYHGASPVVSQVDFRAIIQICSWKSKMKIVVKYYV
jgi:hypothetical protein